jgi:hypothetical protein
MKGKIDFQFAVRFEKVKFVFEDTFETSWCSYETMATLGLASPS